MGFAPVAAVAILMIGGLASFAGYTIANDAAQDELRRVARESAQQDAERAATALAITATNYQNGPNRLTITATNTGSSVIETGDVDVVLDGVVRTQSIVFIQVESSNAAYWAPLESASIRVDQVTSSPGRIALVAHNGVTTYQGVA